MKICTIVEPYPPHVFITNKRHILCVKSNSMNQKQIPEIKGDVFRESREAQGISLAELANKSCLSIKHLEQIESGDSGHFYSAAIKFQAAKRVAEILKIDVDRAFDFGRNDLVQEMNTPDPIAEISLPELKEKKAVTQESEAVVLDKPEVHFSETINATENLKNKSKNKSNIQYQRPIKAYLYFGIAVLVGLFAINTERFFGSKNNLEPNMVASSANSASALPSENASPTSAAEAPAANALPVVSEPAVKSVQPAAVLASNAGEACATPDSNALVYKTPNPNRAGDMVYIQSKVKQMVCVKDGSGKIVNKEMDSGINQSFYGKPPFFVTTAGLSQVDIYFQGYRVRPANLENKSIVLEEVPTSSAQQN